MGTILIIGFGNKLIEFLDFLEKVSGMTEIVNLKTALRLVKNTGQNGIIKAVMEHFMKKTQDHVDSIFNCDTDYFYELDLAGILFDPNDGLPFDQEKVLKEIDTFKNKFREFTKEEQAIFWKHLQELMKIGAQYYVAPRRVY